MEGIHVIGDSMRWLNYIGKPVDLEVIKGEFDQAFSSVSLSQGGVALFLLT